MAKKIVLVSDVTEEEIKSLALVQIVLVGSDPERVRKLELDESEIPAQWLNSATIAGKRGAKRKS